jgi:hypothetical protein
MINLVIKENIKFVTTSAGDPAKYIHVLKDAGIKYFMLFLVLLVHLKLKELELMDWLLRELKVVDLKIQRKLVYMCYCNQYAGILIFQ